MIAQNTLNRRWGMSPPPVLLFETEILLSVKNLCIKTPLMMVGERKINKMFISEGKNLFFPCKMWTEH